MCIDINTGISINRRKVSGASMLEQNLGVDEQNVYFGGKAVPRELWAQQAFHYGLPGDAYLDIAAAAENRPGAHHVSHGGQTFIVNVGEVIHSKYGQHRVIKSIAPYKS